MIDHILLIQSKPNNGYTYLCEFVTDAEFNFNSIIGISSNRKMQVSYPLDVFNFKWVKRSKLIALIMDDV